MLLRFALSFLVLVSSLVLMAGHSHADSEQAKEWLSKMRTAALQESYRGTFMFSRGDMSSSMRVVHRFYDGQEQERLTQLDGEMGEILRRGTEVMCLVNGQRLIQLDKQEFSNPVSSAFADFMPGHDYYALSTNGFERIVDRSSVRLSIKAEDSARYSYYLWLDEASGLLLKSQVIGLNGEALESFQFTELQIPTETDDREFTFNVDETVVSHQRIPMSDADARWPERLVWEAGYVPPGFMTVDSSDSNSNVMLFTDGLANYTVFVEMKEKKVLPEGASRVGATVIYLTPLKFNEREYTVTVVGEIPPMTAMKIAKGVRPEMGR